MNTTPGSDQESVGDALGSAVRDLGVVADALGDQVRPIAKLGVDTAHNVVVAAESVRAAGRGMWRAVKFLDGLRPGAETEAPATTDAAKPAPASAEPSTLDASAALSLLGPTAIINTVRNWAASAPRFPTSRV